MNRPRVLIADDDIGFAKALSLRIEQMGYEVITTTDGYNALAQGVKEKPDLMILDIHMPAGDGFTVQHRLHGNPELPGIPTIYVTGDKSEQASQNARISGAFAIVHKPVDFAFLEEAITRALAARAA
jgi:CheY-like chemotaxis protein